MIVAYHLMRLSVLRSRTQLAGVMSTRAEDSTALHAGKDLAVSPLALPQELFLEGIPWLSPRTSLLAPLTFYRGRGLPATLLQVLPWACSDFPPERQAPGRSPYNWYSTI